MRALLTLSVLLPLVFGAAEAEQASVTKFTTTAQHVPIRPRTLSSAAPRGVTAPHTVIADPATLCETAVTTAEYVNRVPPRLLSAISVTETGRPDPATGRMRPWPWTVNAEGEGRVYETRQDAIAAVNALQARGVQSIDVGCMQVNLMYHPAAFGSLEQAFDARNNANYAARFLNALYAGSHDWSQAIASYHSETPALGDAYRVLVMARWQASYPRTAAPVYEAYRDFVAKDQVYGAFAPSSQVYGAFAPR